MGDLLSAASLLLTAVTVIYGFWYPKIIELLAIVPATHKEDRGEAYREVSQAIRTRTVPLLTISVLLTAVFVPDAFRIACGSFNDLRHNGLTALKEYDAVATSFVLITLILAFLTTHLLIVTKQLFQLRRKLNPK